MARPTKLTPEIMQKIANGIRLTTSIDAAAGCAGVTRRTVRNWMERGRVEKEGLYAEFVEEIDAAMAEAEFNTAVDLRRAAKGDGRLLLEIMQRRFPETWARRAPIEVKEEGYTPQEFAQAIREFVHAAHATVPSVPPEEDVQPP